MSSLLIPASPPATLNDLVSLVAYGDRVSFERLYEGLSARVLGLITRTLVDRAQSEEVAQEVWLEIWQTASRFQSDRGQAVSWILTIAHRRAVDRVRTSQSDRNRDRLVGKRDIGVDHDGVLESAEIKLEHERAVAAMERLTVIQREAIYLAYFAGMTQFEISEQLHVNISTVKTRIRDGLLRLREEMSVLGFSADGRIAI